MTPPKTHMAAWEQLNPLSRKLWDQSSRLIVGGGQAHKRHVRYLARGGPGFFTHAKGAYVYDADGREYIDYLLGYGPIVLGHCDYEFNAIVARQMTQSGVQGGEHPLEIELAERLTKLIPGAEMLMYLIGGSASTSASLRVARAHTGRERVIRCGYHGWHDWCVPASPGVPADERGRILDFPYNDLAALERQLETHRAAVAAVIIESVQDDGPAPGFFAGVRELCDRHGCLFILDEVKTGFRFDLGGAQKLYGIQPDLSTFGKALGNGFPLSVLVGRRHILEKRSDCYCSATFHGDPIACAASLACLDLLELRDGIAHQHRLGRRLIDGLNRVFKDADFPLRMEGHPAMPNPREGYVGEPARPLPSGWAGRCAREWFAAMQRNGVFVNWHVWFLSTAHRAADIEATIKIARKAVKQTCAVMQRPSVD